MGFLLIATAIYFAQPLFERYFSDQLFWWTEYGVILAAVAFTIRK